MSIASDWEMVSRVQDEPLFKKLVSIGSIRMGTRTVTVRLRGGACKSTEQVVMGWQHLQDLCEAQKRSMSSQDSIWCKKVARYLGYPDLSAVQMLDLIRPFMPEVVKTFQGHQWGKFLPKVYDKITESDLRAAIGRGELVPGQMVNFQKKLVSVTSDMLAAEEDSDFEASDGDSNTVGRPLCPGDQINGLTLADIESDSDDDGRESPASRSSIASSVGADDE